MHNFANYLQCFFSCFFSPVLFSEQDAKLEYYLINIVINLPTGRPPIRIFSKASFLTIHYLVVKCYCCTYSCDDNYDNILRNMSNAKNMDYCGKSRFFVYRRRSAINAYFSKATIHLNNIS